MRHRGPCAAGLCGLLFAFGTLLVPTDARAVVIERGDILVVQSGELLLVDPDTGDRTVVAGAGVGSGQGPIASALAVGIDAGEIYVVGSGSRDVLRVDPDTGNRTKLNDRRPIFTGLDLGPDGALLASSRLFLHEIDKVTGALTDLTDSSVFSGPVPRFLNDVLGEADGNVLAVDISQRALYRVDRATGERTILSEDPQNPPTSLWHKLAREEDGSIVVTRSLEPAVLRIDPATGDRTVVSSDTVGAGIPLFRPLGIDVDRDGSLLVTDGFLNTLFRIDPHTGDRTVVSSAERGTGFAFDGPVSVVVVPGPACDDGRDNDGDGRVDARDPGCEDDDDDSERGPRFVCDDGLDNDLDGDTDFPDDPGCRFLFSRREGPECDDNLDNDGDWRADWDGIGGLFEPDPECQGRPTRNREEPRCRPRWPHEPPGDDDCERPWPPPGCEDGVVLALLSPALLWAIGRVSLRFGRRRGA